ncbi:MAG: S28 family serine protease [Salinivirgaceae bacterium]
MNKTSLIVILLCFLYAPMDAQQAVTPQEIVSNITAIDSFRVVHADDFFEESYELWFQQLIDHAHPEKGTFPQRVIYSHKGFDRPMVVELEGYGLWSMSANEITQLLSANQLTIEHRFFERSRPADSIPWSSLTVRNAAADQHRIIQAFKAFYNKKWLTTGISKGGQTTIFHRSLYPTDVDVSVPYVAPVNYSATDERVQLFLDTVGTEACRAKIHQFQKELLKRKERLLPMLEKLADKKEWEFKMGIDKAYDLSVFEFSFALWQWVHADCETIPPLDASDEDVFNYWNTFTGFTFFEERATEPHRPFFFQGLTEIGMYGYNADEFKGLTDFTGMVGFEWTLPDGYENVEFNPETMVYVDKWVKEQGNFMLYLYGGQDAWSATAAAPGDETNAVRLFNPGKNHSTRIKNYPEHLKDSIYNVLENWMEVSIK